MADPYDGEPSPGADRQPGPIAPLAVGPLPWFFVALGAASLVLGFIGLRTYQPLDGAHVLDLLYYDLQLFVLGATPLDELDHAGYPLALQVARFTAPAVTVYAFVEAGRLLFAAELNRRQARGAREHAIVCGDGLVAGAITRRLRQAGRHVVTVSRLPLGPPARRSGGPLRVIGDARDPDVLRAAGIERAAELYACTGDSATNTAIALAAARRTAGTKIAVYGQVSDPDLCLALQARYLGQPDALRVRLDFFNVEDLAARKLIASHPPAEVDGRPPRILVLGATAFGRAVLVELARSWRLRGPGAPRLPLALVDDDAPGAIEEVSLRYPFLAEVCALSGSLDTAPDRVFVCYDDEDRALRVALTAERLWHGGPRSVLVRLDRLAALGESTGGYDDMSPALHLYGAVQAACDPALIADDLVERLARAVHDSYLLGRQRRGGAEPTDPSLVPWERLPEPLRRANRAQATHFGRMLREIHCVLSPRIEPGDGYVPSDVEVEHLARLEHARWIAERGAAGWRHGQERDDERRLHPELVEWDLLTPEMRERNRDAIRDMPTILADAGFRIIRLPTAYR
jgi:uncharacterized protein YbjT (DUF2867 family)